MTTHPGLVVILSLVALVFVLKLVRLVTRQEPRLPLADVNARMAEIDRRLNLEAEAATQANRAGSKLRGSRLVKGHVSHSRQGRF